MPATHPALQGSVPRTRSAAPGRPGAAQVGEPADRGLDALLTPRVVLEADGSVARAASGTAGAAAARASAAAAGKPAPGIKPQKRLLLLRRHGSASDKHPHPHGQQSEAAKHGHCASLDGSAGVAGAHGGAFGAAAGGNGTEVPDHAAQGVQVHVHGAEAGLLYRQLAALGRLLALKPAHAGASTPAGCTAKEVAALRRLLAVAVNDNSAFTLSWLRDELGRVRAAGSGGGGGAPAPAPAAPPPALDALAALSRGASGTAGGQHAAMECCIQPLAYDVLAGMMRSVLDAAVQDADVALVASLLELASVAYRHSGSGRKQRLIHSRHGLAASPHLCSAWLWTHLFAHQLACACKRPTPSASAGGGAEAPTTHGSEQQGACRGGPGAAPGQPKQPPVQEACVTADDGLQLEQVPAAAVCGALCVLGRHMMALGVAEERAWALLRALGEAVLLGRQQGGESRPCLDNHVCVAASGRLVCALCGWG